MRSLFLKIFLSFWIAQALFVVLAILGTMALRPSNEIANLQAQENKFVSDAVQAHQTGGETATWRYLRSIHEAEHVRLYIFNAQGKDIIDRSFAPWVEQARRGELRSADTFWGRLRPLPFLKASVTGPDGQPYTLIIELPERHSMFGPHGIPSSGILIAILTSGLVCYLLAKYLTSPIMRLRAATQKLASGDLSARAGVPESRRHDEMAELLRDFDRMAERLQGLMDAQKRLLTDISHELRSPLARLNVALELARQRSGHEAAGALDRIDRETSRLNKMIEQLLTIVRLEGGDESPIKSEVDLGELIREVAKDAAFEAQSRHCQVAVLVVDGCIVAGNPSLLHSAIENVVRNALRYTQEGTTVHISLEALDAAQTLVRVTDSGPGVPEESLDKLFRPFYRIDDARGRQTGGVGLGLSITERAVTLHGGTIRAANRPEGGLMVEIRLPLAAMPPAEPPSEIEPMVKQQV